MSRIIFKGNTKLHEFPEIPPTTIIEQYEYAFDFVIPKTFIQMERNTKTKVLNLNLKSGSEDTVGMYLTFC